MSAWAATPPNKGLHHQQIQRRYISEAVRTLSKTSGATMTGAEDVALWSKAVAEGYEDYDRSKHRKVKLTPSLTTSARTALGLTVSELADRAGVSVALIAKFEGGGTVGDATVRKLKHTLFDLGVRFSASPLATSAAPGIWLRKAN
jgi:DNA-binding transcriptional regulator YiaG